MRGRASIMANYRLYSLSPEGHIQRVEDFEADDDAEAIAEAGRRGFAPKELWCENRRVQQWPCPEPAENNP
jgi:hypothetical protein